MVNVMGNMMMNRYKPARILASELFLHQSPQNIPRIFPLYDHSCWFSQSPWMAPLSPKVLHHQPINSWVSLRKNHEQQLKIILKQLIKSSQKLENSKESSQIILVLCPESVSSSSLGKSSRPRRPRHTPEARQAQAALHRCELTNKVTSNRHVAHGARLLDSWKL